jgi:hypothetical protein
LKNYEPNEIQKFKEDWKQLEAKASRNERRRRSRSDKETKPAYSGVARTTGHYEYRGSRYQNDRIRPERIRNHPDRYRSGYSEKHHHRIKDIPRSEDYRTGRLPVSRTHPETSRSKPETFNPGSVLFTSNAESVIPVFTTRIPTLNTIQPVPESSRLITGSFKPTSETYRSNSETYRPLSEPFPTSTRTLNEDWNKKSQDGKPEDRTHVWNKDNFSRNQESEYLSDRPFQNSFSSSGANYFENLSSFGKSSEENSKLKTLNEVGRSPPVWCQSRPEICFPNPVRATKMPLIINSSTTSSPLRTNERTLSVDPFKTLNERPSELVDPFKAGGPTYLDGNSSSTYKPSYSAYQGKLLLMQKVSKGPYGMGDGLWVRHRFSWNFGSISWEKASG